MGDRTTVRLTVLKVHGAAAEGIMESAGYPFDEAELVGEFALFTFHEVNNGDLNFLEALLKAGIAYDSHWNEGGDYSAGTERVRFFEDGEFEFTTIYDRDINPNLELVESLIDKPAELMDYLQGCIYDSKHPWDNQEEWGKIYLTKQLISPP